MTSLASLPATRPLRVLLAGAAFALGACATVNPYYDERQPHHRPDGFQNRHAGFQPKTVYDLVRWRWDASVNGLPPPAATPTPRVTPDLAFIAANARAGAAMQPAATWIGHSTVLVQAGGLNLLTDPMFSDRASPLAFVGPVRAQPPGLALAELPHIDVVLISHDHYDHLDEASVRALAAQPGGPPRFVVPLGVGRRLAGWGIEGAVELDWWQSHRASGPAGEVEVVLTPAQHWSGRTLADHMSTLWGGFAIFAPDLHLYYAGDTGWSPDFADIRERFAARNLERGFDIALIPIGAYEPRWFMREQHVDPDEAVRIHREVRAQRSIGVHWGTFSLTDEALDEPPRALAAARRAQGVDDDRFVALAIGQTRLLPPRGSAIIGAAAAAAPAAITPADAPRGTTPAR